MVFQEIPIISPNQTMAYMSANGTYGWKALMEEKRTETSNTKYDIDELCTAILKKGEINVDVYANIYHFFLTNRDECEISHQCEEQLRKATVFAIQHRAKNRTIGSGPSWGGIPQEHPTDKDPNPNNVGRRVEGCNDVIEINEVFFENGQISPLNLHYDYVMKDPFEVLRSLRKRAPITKRGWSEEEYAAITDQMENIKTDVTTGLKRMQIYSRMLNIQPFMLDTALQAVKDHPMYKKRKKWNNHEQWKKVKDGDPSLADEIDEIDFQIGAILLILPRKVCPEEWRGKLAGPSHMRFDWFFHRILGSMQDNEEDPSSEEEIAIEEQSEEEDNDLPNRRTGIRSTRAVSTKESSRNLSVLPWAPHNSQKQDKKKEQLGKVTQVCAQLFDKGPRTQKIWLKGAIGPTPLGSVKLNSKFLLKPRQIYDLIPVYEPRSVKTAMKFVEKCGRAFQNTNIPAIYLDEVISTRLEDTEAERLWYEEWRATNPAEREDFDVGFKRRFLPIVDYNEIVRKCHEYIPEAKTNAIDLGNDLRKAIRPYIRLLQNPMEQMQAEKALMTAYRNLLGPTWSLQISMARCADIDEAIQLLYNYKLENPGEEMICTGIKKTRVNCIQLEEEGQSVNVFTKPNSYHCDYCRRDGHTKDRCIRLALSQGKPTPPGYKCRICSEIETHLTSSCPKKPKDSSDPKGRDQPTKKEAPLAKPEWNCYRCGGKGHFIRDCPSALKNTEEKDKSGN
jgi:hypothetical protein